MKQNNFGGSIKRRIIDIINNNDIISAEFRFNYHPEPSHETSIVGMKPTVLV